MTATTTAHMTKRTAINGDDERNRQSNTRMSTARITGIPTLQTQNGRCTVHPTTPTVTKPDDYLLPSFKPNQFNSELISHLSINYGFASVLICRRNKSKNSPSIAYVMYKGNFLFSPDPNGRWGFEATEFRGPTRPSRLSPTAHRLQLVWVDSVEFLQAQTGIRTWFDSVTSPYFGNQTRRWWLR